MPTSPALALVDPISTGACVAVEAVRRGYTVVALWSHDSPAELRDIHVYATPEGLKPARPLGAKGVEVFV